MGEQNPARWQRIATAYRKLGLLTDDKLPEALIWKGDDGNQRLPLMAALFVIVGLAIAALVVYRSRASFRWMPMPS